MVNQSERAGEAFAFFLSLSFLTSLPAANAIRTLPCRNGSHKLSERPASGDLRPRSVQLNGDTHPCEAERIPFFTTGAHYGALLEPLEREGRDGGCAPVSPFWLACSEMRLCANCPYRVAPSHFTSFTEDLLQSWLGIFVPLPLALNQKLLL